MQRYALAAALSLTGWMAVTTVSTATAAPVGSQHKQRPYSLGVEAQSSASAESAAQPAPHHRWISEARARAIALRRVPGGRVLSEEFEHESGRWIYSYDIKTAGRPGIDEVHIDGRTGRILRVKHESPAQERKERAAEKSGGK
jgi:uncharacterized membrane protein YkoI